MWCMHRREDDTSNWRSKKAEVVFPRILPLKWPWAHSVLQSCAAMLHACRYPERPTDKMNIQTLQCIHQTSSKIARFLYRRLVCLSSPRRVVGTSLYKNYRPKGKSFPTYIFELDGEVTQNPGKGRYSISRLVPSLIMSSISLRGGEASVGV